MFERDWEPAEATIISERLLTSWGRGAHGNATVPHEYVVDVRPQGQPPFRATFHEPLMHGHYDHPRPGEVVQVLFNPKNHKVKLAPEYKSSPRQQRRAEDEQFNAIADGAPGTEADQPATTRVIRPPS